MITDTDRFDFIEQQRNPTFWIGYDTDNGYLHKSIFGGKNIRAAIDLMIEGKQRYETYKMRQASEIQSYTQTKREMCSMPTSVVKLP